MVMIRHTEAIKESGTGRKYFGTTGAVLLNWKTYEKSSKYRSDNLVLVLVQIESDKSGK
jgi:hypothetical protein